MKKKLKLLICFLIGLIIISAFAYLLFVAETSNISLGLFIILGGIFLFLLQKIVKIKNEL